MIRFIKFLLAISIASTCCAQQQNTTVPLILSNISEENGLSDDHVRCVWKDHNGFVWIGTADGLDLMDGSTIRVFRHRDGDSTSLPSSDIATLAEDSVNHLLYIGTSHGLAWYDLEKKTFHSAILPESPYGVSMFMQQIIVLNHVAWCATDGGLFSFDPQQKIFKPYFNESREQGTDPRFSNKLVNMTSSKGDLLWICSNDGFWNYDTRQHLFRKIIHRDNDPNYHPLCMSAYVDHEQNIWAGFWNTGLRKYDTHTGRVTAFSPGDTKNLTISCINEIRTTNGNYVLWLNGDLLGFDEKVNRFFHFRSPSTLVTPPALNPVYQSRDGWVWLGSNNGLYIYNPQRQLFRQFTFPGSITSQGISFMDYRGHLLVGAQGHDFLKWMDSEGNILGNFSATGNNKSTLLCFKEVRPGEFWIGTDNGVLHTQLQSGASNWFHHVKGDNHSLPRNFIPSLLMDSKGHLWVFPWREGIWQMDPQTGRCDQLYEGFSHEVDGIKKLVIGDAAEDMNGNIWMADLDEGIILYEARTRKFSKPFEQTLGARYSTSRLFIRGHEAYSFVADGIIRWNIDNRQVQKISLPAEMNKGLTDMYPDLYGNWWLTSRNGLIAYNEKDNRFNRFTTADGLSQNDINGSLYCSADSTMWIGTPSYFLSFNPSQLMNGSSDSKEILITGILAGNQEIDKPVKGPVTLGYRENNLVIRWALPDYGNPLRNEYYVKLDGIDPAWRYVGNKGEVQYANLSPGNYSIRLRAATANGVDARKNIILDFVIQPPFWKTTWFILVTSFFLITVFILVVRYVSQRNLKEKLLRLEKEQAVEKERNRISRDMHDDLGSGLTKIAILSEVVKKQIHEPEKAREQLENISHSSRELVDNLQDIIWVLNPKNDTLESLAAYIREYGLKFYEPFGTELQFDYPEKFTGVKLSEETRRNIFLVIKETFNNIARHAWCNRVMVSIHQKARGVEISITDDGKGFDIGQVRAFGNGLTNMKNRIEQVGGTFCIESQIGQGTRTILVIPV